MNFNLYAGQIDLTKCDLIETKFQVRDWFETILQSQRDRTVVKIEVIFG